jgi:hypothetical protein
MRIKASFVPDTLMACTVAPMLYELVSPGQGPVAGSCEYVNEPSGFIKGGKFLDNMNE